MTLKSSDSPKVTAPSEKVASALEGSTVLIEGVNDVTTTAPEGVFAPPGPELQPQLGRWNQWNRHERPLLSGVWCIGKVSLHTQRVSSHSFMLSKPGFLKNKGVCVLATSLLLSTPPPHAWRTICCAPKVFIGIRC